MSKLHLPKLPIAQARQGISFDPPAAALKRWNSGLKAQEDDASISIYEFIGDDGMGGGVTVSRIAGALRRIGSRDVTVNINSPGGDIFEAAAIYNLLRDHPKQVNVRVLGVAASAASVIAMAGDTIEIGLTAWLMVHNIWVIAMGNKNDLRKIADQLEPFDDTFAALYAARTGIPKAEIAALMDAETWFSGQEAVDAGFADALLPADKIEDNKDNAPSAAAAIRRIDVALAREGMPRSERRALLKQIKGTPSAALEPTRDAGEEQAAAQQFFETLQSITKEYAHE